MKPTNIVLHQASNVLEISFESGETFKLSCEYLRVNSPSAEVQGHGPSQRILQLDKHLVRILAIRPMGNYAILLEFDDGHRTGIYSWPTLYDLGRNHAHNWAAYQAEVAHFRASKPAP